MPSPMPTAIRFDLVRRGVAVALMASLVLMVLPPSPASAAVPVVDQVPDQIANGGYATTPGLPTDTIEIDVVWTDEDVSDTHEVRVVWGDGSDIEYGAQTSPYTVQHTFSAPGDYYGRAYVREVGGSWQTHDLGFYTVVLDVPTGAEAKFVSPDRSPERFGQTLEVDAGRLLVGAPREDDGRGQVHALVRDGSTWSLQQTVVPAARQAGASFGTAIDLDGDTLVVGSAGRDDDLGTNSVGAAHVFAPGTDGWEETQLLVPDGGAAYDNFGLSVAVDGNRLAVGDPAHDWGGARLDDHGAVYLYERDTSGTWQFVDKVGPTREVFDRFGTSVDLEGNLLVVGSPGDLDTENNKNGTVYAYRWDDTGVSTPVAWPGPAVPTDALNGAAFGSSVDLSGEGLLAVGAPGGRPSDSATPWGSVSVMGVSDAPALSLVDRVSASGDQWDFGESVAMAGEVVAVRTQNTTVGADPQVALVQPDGAGGWTQTTTLDVSPGIDSAGNSGPYENRIAVDGSRVYLGHTLDNDADGTSVRPAGAAYAWPLPPPPPPSSGPVSLTVTDVSSDETDADGSPVDMYVQAEFGPTGEQLDTRGEATVDTASAQPDWRLTSQQPYSASELTLSVALLDDGDVPAILDLDAADGDHTLDLVIDRTTGVWSGDLSHPERCVTGPQGTLCFDLDNVDASDPDTDGDGISDREELSGELSQLGADPCRRTIAVELDHMPGVAPAADASTMVVDAFDVAPVPAVTDCPYVGFPRSDSGIDLVLAVDEEVPDTTDITEAQVKALRDGGHLAPFRRPWWHWGLYAGSIARENAGGFCCLDRWDFVSVNLVANGDDLVKEAATLMHELGHALGLGHGGSDRVNRKPNYISIMNYSFALTGLTRASDMSPVLDYSRWELPELNETSLSQPQVLGETGYLTTWSSGLFPGAERVADTAEEVLWSYLDYDQTTGVTHDITFEYICVEGGPNGVLDTDAAEGDIGSSYFPRIVAGDDRDCDTAAQGDDRQVREQGFEQVDVLSTQNDWDNLHYRGALSGDTSLGGFDPGHVDPDPESMSEVIEFWDRVRSDPDNLPPDATDDDYETAADTPLTVTAPGVLGNDTDGDGDPLTASLLVGPASGTVELQPDGALRYVPDAGFVGSDSFDYVATDGEGQLSRATVTVTVAATAENRPPTAADDSYATDEDTVLTVGAPGVLDNDTDPDIDPLAVSLDVAPSSGTASVSSDGSFVYEPAVDTSGTDSFTYAACDPDGACDTATVSITVNPVNDAPVATDDSYTTPHDTPLEVAAPGVLGNDGDVEDDPLTAQLDSPPSNGSVTVDADGAFTYTPNPGHAGTDSFTYSASDGDAADSATVTVTVEQDTGDDDDHPWWWRWLWWWLNRWFG